MNQLYDFYGQLLTAKQQRAMEWYFAHDLSLAEIANELNISRQAVHDLLQRSESVLEMYESKLRLAQRYAQQQAYLSQLRCLLDELQDETDLRWQQVFELLREMSR